MTVVGIFYPPSFNRDLDDHVARILAIDPGVEVIVEPYQESSELRTGRGVRPWDHLRAEAPELTDAQRSALARVECCLALDLPFDTHLLAPNLRWVQGLGAGVAQLESAGLAEGGIRLTSASGVTSTAIAEFVLARILAEYKRFRRLDEAQAEHRWQSIFGEELAGATIGLIGLGAINTEVARRARAFGLRILATRRSGAASEFADEVMGPGRLHEMLARSDIVVAAVPESSDTDGLVDAGAFAAMPDGAMFVNVGRGSLVDEDALVAALADGHLRAAAIDVARVEPLPADSPLWDAPNLSISAHCSTDPSTLFVRLHELFEDNLRRYLAGAPLRNEVTFA